MEYIANGNPVTSVYPEPEKEPADALLDDCCLQGCGSLGTESERPDLLSTCHITTMDAEEPIYMTDNIGFPICLKEVNAVVEYRLNDGDVDA